eukprot:983072-Pyramimonas_sp.AAC.1
MSLMRVLFVASFVEFDVIYLMRRSSLTNGGGAHLGFTCGRGEAVRAAPSWTCCDMEASLGGHA